MRKWIVLLALMVPSVGNAKYLSFACTFANGQSVEVIARDGNIAVDFDKKGDWQKAFGRVEGSMVTITEIVAGVGVLFWLGTPIQTKRMPSQIITGQERGWRTTPFAIGGSHGHY